MAGGRPLSEGGTPAQIKAREYERQRRIKQREKRSSPEYKAQVAATIAASVAAKENEYLTMAQVRERKAARTYEDPISSETKGLTAWDRRMAVVERDEEHRRERAHNGAHSPTSNWPSDSIITPPTMAQLMGRR